MIHPLQSTGCYDCNSFVNKLFWTIYIMKNRLSVFSHIWKYDEVFLCINIAINNTVSL